MTQPRDAHSTPPPPHTADTGVPRDAADARWQVARIRQIGLEHGLLPTVASDSVDQLAQLQPRPRARAAKRALDIVLGTVLSLLALPLILAAALAAAVSLRTQPFFVQRRVGELGRDFLILKIRTLPKSVPAYGNKMELGVETMRLPLVARLLRNCHLDELPQLFLVPLGHMSLVGPRPCQPAMIEPMPPEVELMRTAVPQGCTGVWQISEASHGLASGSPSLDEFYLRNGCIRLDLWILARTVAYVLGLVKGITTDDIPGWVRGRGLIMAAEAAPAVAPEATEEHRTIVLPDVAEAHQTIVLPADPVPPTPRRETGLPTPYVAEAVAD